MIKVFTLNKNGKIELTKKELEQLLNESYWEGYRNNNNNYWTYTSPSVIKYRDWYTTNTATSKTPYNVSTSTTSNSITIKSNLGEE